MLSVEQAQRILRRNQLRATGRHTHVHKEAMAANAVGIRALEGICGQCSHLELQIKPSHRRQSLVEIRCSTGSSPLSLYQKTDLGKTPECFFFSQ